MQRLGYCARLSACLAEHHVAVVYPDDQHQPLSATHKDAPWVKNVFAALRPAIIGLIAAAALLLMNKENFGTPAQSIPYFIMSIALCMTVFFATLRYKDHPILAMLAGSWD